MLNSEVHISILAYPGCMQSAVQGLKELFFLASDLCKQNAAPQRFSVELIEGLRLKLPNEPTALPNGLHIVIIPPNVEGDYYRHADRGILQWIKQQHSGGAVISSICAGAFILADTGLLTNRTVTTHWGLAREFETQHPDVPLDTNKILINDRDIITAGGLMAWVDLGLELVAEFAGAAIMRQLGKLMVVDTGQREQRFYKSFVAPLNHGDPEILKAQHFLQSNFARSITIAELAELSCLGERTFLRRFIKATGEKPTHYLQKLRIQKACEQLESNRDTIEHIAYGVGYEDASAFRKTFIKIMGLTPKEFRARFGNS